jgi:cytochrome c oxidase subunit 3
MLETLAKEDVAVSSSRDEQGSQLCFEEAVQPAGFPLPAARLALWVVLATVIMLFAGFTSAYLVRRAAPDWIPIYSPPILLISTVLLLLSSLTMEMAKASRKAERAVMLRSWLLTSIGLGLAFVGAQFLAWQQLANAGIFLPNSPHGSFFYMLTGVHGAHVLGGMGALLYSLRREWNLKSSFLPVNAVALSATYWHFVTGIWIFLYFLLFVWQ